MWVRGLKLQTRQNNKQGTRVAPHVGAWIETVRASTSLHRDLSHPMWVRGLKLYEALHHT